MFTYTTPIIVFKFDGLDLAFVDFVRLAIKGGRYTVIREIQPADIDPDTGETIVKLTQQETAALGPGVLIMQARIKYTDGTVEPTDQVKGTLEQINDGTVI